MNSAASFLRSFWVFGSSGPASPARPAHCCRQLARSRPCGARLPPDPDRCRRLLPRRRRPRLFLVGGLSPAASTIDLGRVLRLRDDVRRIRVDEADHDVDQALLAGLDLLVGPQQELVRGTGSWPARRRTASRPSSMRLAMRISPSRVSSSTVPISRMYMRTGSVVRPSSASSAASAAAASSMASSSAGVGWLGRPAATRYPAPSRTPGCPCR